MASIFGTDGVRGLANEELTPELALNLAKAAGQFFLLNSRGSNLCKKIIIGRDTRISGDMIQGALIAGFTALGFDVHLAGIIPTPAIAYLCRCEGYIGGAMISASHNPIDDNGIKFFNSGGVKFTDSEEAIVENMLGKELLTPVLKGRSLGRVYWQASFQKKYLDYLVSIFSGTLEGYTVAVDTAYGAAWEIAPLLWERLGAKVVAINAQLRGDLINKGCGSTDLRMLQDAMKSTRADMGFAYDGDADRVIALDEYGHILNGDHIMAICGRELILRNALPEKTVVATSYSNKGLEECLVNVGGKLVTVSNGDRYVLEAMQEKGYKLGGEQSGHIIFLNHNTTGDGLLTSLQLAQIIKDKKESLASLATIMKPWPQLIENVYVKNKKWQNSAKVQAVIATCEGILKEKGRLLVRASGTEPVIRVMVEGRERQCLLPIIKQVSDVIKEELNT